MTKDYTLYTLGDFYGTTEQVVDGESIFKGISHGELLAFRDINGTTNLEQIYYKYNVSRQEALKVDFQAELKKIQAGAISDVSWTHVYQIGTVIAVPIDKISLATAARDGGNNQIRGNKGKNKKFTDSNTYLAEDYEDLLRDERFLKKVKLHVDDAINSSVDKSAPQIRVYIWSRALLDGSQSRLRD